MTSSDEAYLEKIHDLRKNFDRFVEESTATLDFRADLAGLLVVAMAASYEGFIKDVMVAYAARHHHAFGTFVENHFEKLNSRVALKDLMRYAKICGPEVHAKFKEILDKRTGLISDRLGINIKTELQNILDWRHAYAHAGIRNTTISEALRTHMFAVRVLRSFKKALV